MNGERIEHPIQSEGEVREKPMAKEELGAFSVAPDSTIQKEEPYPLKEELQKIVREYFEKRGYTIVEMSDTHVKVISYNGAKMNIPNKTAIEVATGGVNQYGG
jgi:hypothetical protein